MRKRLNRLETRFNQFIPLAIFLDTIFAYMNKFPVHLFVLFSLWKPSFERICCEYKHISRIIKTRFSTRKAFKLEAGNHGSLFN